jgi:hypothetical protein
MNFKKGLIIGSIVFVVIGACIVIVYQVFGFSSNSFFEIGSSPLDLIFKRF